MKLTKSTSFRNNQRGLFPAWEQALLFSSRMAYNQRVMRAPFKLVLILVMATLFLSAAGRAQGLAQQALSVFPSDTLQLAYTDLSTLRDLPNYAAIRQALFTRQMRAFSDFLQAMGNDPDEDVSEVVMGWRGAAGDAPGFFGIATGQFHPNQAASYVKRSRLPQLTYQGYNLDTFGSGQDPADLYFAFLSADMAVFGHLKDVKAMLDAWSGSAPALDSNKNMTNWEAEMENSGPQWGITTGKSAASLIAPWLLGAASSQQKALTDFLAPVRAVLYHVDWQSDFTLGLSIVCDQPAQASAFAQLLSLWRDSQKAGASSSAQAVNSFISGMQISSDGNRVEVSGSGPANLVALFFSGGGAN